MAHQIRVVTAAAAIGLLAAACGSSSNSNTASSASATDSKTVTASVSQATTTAAAPPAMTATGGNTLRPLVPVPADTQRTDGPDPIQENGIHLHFFVTGAPTDVMAAYKTALQGKNWTLIVDSSSGGGGGGGATYTANNGNAFGVFTGGGWGSTTDVDACAWPSKPSDNTCGHRR